MGSDSFDFGFGQAVCCKTDYQNTAFGVCERGDVLRELVVTVGCGEVVRISSFRFEPRIFVEANERVVVVRVEDSFDCCEGHRAEWASLSESCRLNQLASRGKVGGTDGTFSDVHVISIVWLVRIADFRSRHPKLKP